MIPNPSSRPDRSAVARSLALIRCPAAALNPMTSRATRRSSSEARLCAQAVTAPIEPSASMAASFGHVSCGNHSRRTQNATMQPARSIAPARHNGV